MSPQRVLRLPREWKEVRCGDVIDVRDGTHDTPAKVPSGIPLITSKNLLSDGLSFEDVTYISREDHLEIEKRSAVHDGDVLFAMIGTIGNPVIVKKDRSFSIKNVALFKMGGSRIDATYFKELLKSPTIVRQLEAASRGGNQKFVSLQVLRDMRIPVPPLSEQRRIAAILDKADAIRRKRQQALRLTETFLRSAFLDMFGDPAGNPKGWPIKPIAEFGDVVTGNTPSRAVSDYYGDAIEWIKSDNINTSSHYLTRASEGLSEVGRKVARTVPAGSVLITCIAGSPDCIGNAAIADRSVAFNQQINAICPSPGANHRFLYAQILVGKQLIQSASTESMKGMVSKGRLCGIPLICPHKPLQDEFGARFDKVIQLHKNAESQSDAMNRFFDALVGLAFTGQLAC